MGGFSGKFESARQDYETPDELFSPLMEKYKFTLDVAVSSENTKCDRFFTESDNGLKQPWHGVCWLNPPYGRPIRPWLEKAVSEMQRGVTTVTLIPARTNTNWFHDLCLKHGSVTFVRGRPRFSGLKHGLPQPLVIVAFIPQEAE